MPFRGPFAPFVAHGLECAGFGFRFQYSLDCLALKGLILEGMFDGAVDVAAFVVLFHPEDIPGVEAAVPWDVLPVSPLKTPPPPRPGDEGLPYRLQAVAYLFCREVVGVLHLFPWPGRLPFMPGYEVDLGTVDRGSRAPSPLWLRMSAM